MEKSVKENFQCKLRYIFYLWIFFFEKKQTRNSSEAKTIDFSLELFYILPRKLIIFNYFLYMHKITVKILKYLSTLSFKALKIIK